jgi:hypothetical protein
MREWFERLLGPPWAAFTPWGVERWARLPYCRWSGGITDATIRDPDGALIEIRRALMGSDADPTLDSSERTRGAIARRARVNRSLVSRLSCRGPLRLRGLVAEPSVGMGTAA